MGLSWIRQGADIGRHRTGWYGREHFRVRTVTG
jgi:hypothetical protein